MQICTMMGKRGLCTRNPRALLLLRVTPVSSKKWHGFGSFWGHRPLEVLRGVVNLLPGMEKPDEHMQYDGEKGSMQ